MDDTSLFRAFVDKSSLFFPRVDSHTLISRKNTGSSCFLYGFVRCIYPRFPSMISAVEDYYPHRKPFSFFFIMFSGMSCFRVHHLVVLA